ncbi:MAG: hypothetical protein JKY81_09185 [Colwellia sp.]|nr:hypothetical protein [Colwellia sp.]
MKLSKSKKIVLIHSLIWAGLLLALAFLLKGNQQINTILIFMIGGWYISHAVIIKALRVNDTENSSKTCCL